MSNLRPGDELLSPVGKPYDTLEEVIGIRPSRGSLAEYGITYSRWICCRTVRLITMESAMQSMKTPAWYHPALQGIPDTSNAVGRANWGTDHIYQKYQTGCHLYG